MAKAYTPGLRVTGRVRHRARRVLPLPGDVLVGVGRRVAAQDVVARTLLPGDVTPLNLANVLSVPPGDVPECLLKQAGERIEIGEPLAKTKGLFGMFQRTYASKHAGTIESISPVTGQLILRGEPLPVEVRAFLAGEVVETLPGEGVTIEAEVALVQGIFGIGGEAFGPIRLACDAADQEVSPDRIRPEMRGAVVVGGARMTGDAVRKAIDVGCSALISGGMDDQDLRDILGYDLGVAITGAERVGITLIVTEGFGEIAMAQRTFDLLRSHAGREAAVDGTTQIRAGVMRPLIVIPLDETPRGPQAERERSQGTLDVGTRVRIIRDPYFGVIGTVRSLPAELQRLDSGTSARVVEVTADGRDALVVPRANVELIEE